MKTFNLFFFILLSTCVFAQKTYTDSRDRVHLCGHFKLSDLNEGPYSEWFSKHYEAETFDSKSAKWKKSLKDTKVTVYLGTWCGDSKYWVPRFVKLWDELGLDRDQIEFIGLYNLKDKMKEGPNGEHLGKNIFRVPTIIFEQQGREIARIVEYPVNDLKTDVAQIALGYPSNPRYRAANYLGDLMEKESREEIVSSKKHLYHLYDQVGKSSELNSYGYLLMGRGEIEKALIVFEMNMHLFRKDPNVYDSYAECLLVKGDLENSLTYYEKAFEMDPTNENAAQQIEKIKVEIAEAG